MIFCVPALQIGVFAESGLALTHPFAYNDRCIVMPKPFSGGFVDLLLI